MFYNSRIAPSGTIKHFLCVNSSATEIRQDISAVASALDGCNYVLDLVILKRQLSFFLLAAKPWVIGYYQ